MSLRRVDLLKAAAVAVCALAAAGVARAEPDYSMRSLEIVREQLVQQQARRAQAVHAARDHRVDVASDRSSSPGAPPTLSPEALKPVYPATERSVGLARRLLVAWGAQSSVEKVREREFGWMGLLAMSNLPESSAAVRLKAMEMIGETDVAAADTALARIVAETFSEDELTRLLQFYESPLATSAAQKEEVVRVRAMGMIDELSRERRERAWAELCRDGGLKGDDCRTLPN